MEVRYAPVVNFTAEESKCIIKTLDLFMRVGCYNEIDGDMAKTAHDISQDIENFLNVYSPRTLL